MTEIYDGTQNLNEYTVKFYADWCGPCKAYAPLFEELATKDSNGKYIIVDVDKHPSAAERYQIRSIPTVIADGEKVKDYLAWTKSKLA